MYEDTDIDIDLRTTIAVFEANDFAMKYNIDRTAVRLSDVASV